MSRAEIQRQIEAAGARAVHWYEDAPPMSQPKTGDVVMIPYVPGSTAGWTLLGNGWWYRIWTGSETDLQRPYMVVTLRSLRGGRATR